MSELKWEGVETITTDTYYDICQGYYNGEVSCEYTKKKLVEAIQIMESLVQYLEKNDLVG